MTERSTIKRWSRITWLASGAVIFGVGVGVIWWPAAQQIAQVRAHARELYDEANDIDNATRRSSQLRAVETRVRADLRSVGGLRAEGAVTAAMLQLFHDEARHEDVEIEEVAPDEGSRASGVPRNDGSPGSALDGHDLSIGARGPFRNVVSLIADLPRHDVLIDIRDVAITATGESNHQPILAVTMHATAYRILPTTELEGYALRAR